MTDPAKVPGEHASSDRSERTFDVEIDGRRRLVSINTDGAGLRVRVDGVPRRVDVAEVDRSTLSLIFPEEQGRTTEVTIRTAGQANQLVVELDGTLLNARLRNANTTQSGVRRSETPRGQSRPGVTEVLAPMPGKVVRVLVAPGEVVTARQGIAIVEAMKMENELRASSDGVVKQVLVTEGASIEAGAVICVLE